MSTNEPRLLALITHDLRNGLNAINMSLHMIEGGVPEGHPELEADIQMLQESVGNLRRMLNHLSDYAQLLEGEARSTVDAFSPARILQDVVSEFRDDPDRQSRIRLVLDPGSPEMVELDPRRSFEALRYALSNALGCDESGEVLVRSSGRDGRWLVTIRDPSPLTTDTGVEGLDPRRMERLLSNRRERRGIDLAIVAGISRMFGGSARLQAHPDDGTELVLDWPTRLPRTSGIPV